MKFEDKVVLITGSGTGIGMTVAKKFIENGASVIILGRRKEAFAVTLTQYENQAESQDAESEISDEIIPPWTEEFDYTENIISVTGTASASSEPDTLIVVLGVESEAKTANESLSKNSNSLNSVISSLTSSGISEDDIQTSNFRIYPLYDSIKDSNGNYQQILIGYRVSNILSIQTDKINLAGNIIDAAVSSGANRVDTACR